MGSPEWVNITGQDDDWPNKRRSVYVPPRMIGWWHSRKTIVWGARKHGHWLPRIAVSACPEGAVLACVRLPRDHDDMANSSNARFLAKFTASRPTSGYEGEFLQIAADYLLVEEHFGMPVRRGQLL